MKLRYSAVMAGVAALALAYGLAPRQDAAPVVPAAAPVARAAAPAAPEPDRSRAQNLSAPPAAAPAAAPVTLAQRVDALAKRGDPVSQFEAYKLVRDCRVSRVFAATVAENPASAKVLNWRPEAEACGDITAAQMATRLQWANAAADVGVHGAVEAVSREGPNGDFFWGESDPTVLAAFNERVVAQVKAGVKTGDPASLSTAFSWYDGGAFGDRDPVQALPYAVAWAEVTTGRIQYYAKGTVERIKREVPPEKVDEAVAAGHALVAAIQPAPLGRTQ